MLKYILTIIAIILIFVLESFKNKISKNVRIILKTIFVVLFLEFTIFNINSYRTDFEKLDYMEFVQDDLYSKINLTTDDTQYISIENIDSKVKSIFLELDGLKEKQIVDYDIIYADESTSDRYLATKSYCQNVEKTKYSTISLSGNCKKIAINVKNLDVKIVRINFE